MQLREARRLRGRPHDVDHDEMGYKRGVTALELHTKEGAPVVDDEDCVPLTGLGQRRLQRHRAPRYQLVLVVSPAVPRLLGAGAIVRQINRHCAIPLAEMGDLSVPHVVVIWPTMDHEHQRSNTSSTFEARQRLRSLLRACVHAERDTADEQNEHELPRRTKEEERDEYKREER
jgi:hypothetical protein